MTVGTTAVLVELQLRPIRFAGRAVKAGVFALVNVAVRLNAFKNFLHNFFVTRLACADEVVVGDVKFFPEVFEAVDNRVEVFERRFALGLCGALNFLAVFLGARQEKNFITCQAFVAGNGVGNRRAVGVPDVQFRARIINRCRDVKSFHWVSSCVYLKIFFTFRIYFFFACPKKK